MNTKNKLLPTIICLFMVVFSFVCLTSCNEIETCVHQWGDWQIKTNATCTEEGIQERKCSLCDETETYKIDAIGHAWKSATCIAPKTCTVCQVSEDSVVNHSGGAATCTKKANCAVCGVEYGELGEHQGEEIWIKHTGSHYLVYSCCYEPASVSESHTIVGGICSECGFNPTITITSAEVASGAEQVLIAFSIADNPGIIGLTATLQYSSDVFTLTDVRNGEALNPLTFTAPSSLDNGCTFMWDSVEINDRNIKDGDFLILTFDIADNAPEGEYSLLLNINAFDNDLNRINLKVVGGKITINNN